MLYCDMIETIAITSVDGNRLQTGCDKTLEDAACSEQNLFMYLLCQLLGIPAETQAQPEKGPGAPAPETEWAPDARPGFRPAPFHLLPGRLRTDTYSYSGLDAETVENLQITDATEWKPMPLQENDAKSIKNISDSPADTDGLRLGAVSGEPLLFEEPLVEAPDAEKNVVKKAEEISVPHYAQSRLMQAETTDGPRHTIEIRSSGIGHLERLEHLERPFHIVQDGNRLTVSLEPDGMGKLDINLSLEKGVLHAHVHVQDEQARSLMENNMRQLIETLTREGLNVGGFMVSLGKNNARRDDPNEARTGAEGRGMETGHLNNHRKIKQHCIVSIFA